jgi:hypothetical protein
MDVGASLGGYRLLRRLGKGGMGEVFEAEHERTGLRVGLKILHKELATNHEMVERFYLEARTASRIGCPHIVDVTDICQDSNGGMFLVMELLSGESLGDRLAREIRLGLPQALDICAQIADALDSAHGAGVIHRDLKPDNIFLVPTSGGRVFVKLLDFGLAKMVEGGGPALTKAGVVLGTAEYMSPEQAESRKDIDHRADVYALGIVLYQTTTGYVPFVGKSMGEVLLKQIARAPASPRTVLPTLPAGVEQIIMRCLCKRRADRYQSMADLRVAILDPDADLAWRGAAPGFGERPGPVQPSALAKGAKVVGQPAGPGPVAAPAPAPARVRPGERRRLLMAAALAIVFVLTVALTWQLLPASPPPAAVRAATPPLAAVPAARAVAIALPATIHVTVTSRPPGATVYRAGDDPPISLGTTPVEITLPSAAEPRTLVLELEGHAPARITVAGDRDASFAVELPAP